MKTTDKDYIEAVADLTSEEKFGKNNNSQEEYLYNTGIEKGYQLALDHTNILQLQEAVKENLRFLKVNFDLQLPSLQQALEQSEKSKL